MKAAKDCKTVSILGFRDVKIGDVDAFFKNVRTSICPATVQIVDAARVAGKPHLFFAFLNAQKSFERGQAISGNIEMEILLYAAATRQISRAIEIIGIKPKTTSIVAAILASSELEDEEAKAKLIKLVSGVRDDSVLDIMGMEKVENLIAAFGVTELELKTMTSPRTAVSEVLTWLIVERISLLTVKH